MPKDVERRQAPRVAIEGRVASRVQSLVEATLVNLSQTGALVTLPMLLRPESRCDLLVWVGKRDLRLNARVVRSIVGRATKPAEGLGDLVYHTGLEFLDLTREQQAQLATLLQTFQAGGSNRTVVCVLL